MTLAAATILVALLAATPESEPVNATLKPAAPIRVEVEVAAPRPDVFRAFTTTDGVTTFFAPAARVELRADGPYELYFNPSAAAGSRGSEGCRVLSYVEDEMVSFTWNAPPTLGNAARMLRSFVVVQLSDAGPGRTRVQLTHAGFGAGQPWEEIRTYFARAWPAVLKQLQTSVLKGPIWHRVEVAQPARRPYVYSIRPVHPEHLEKPTPAEAQALQGHVEHIRSLLAAGRLVVAGPSFDPSLFPKSKGTVPFRSPPPGLVIFYADNDADALATLEADPAVRAGVFAGRVNPLKLSFLGP